MNGSFSFDENLSQPAGACARPAGRRAELVLITSLQLSNQRVAKRRRLHHHRSPDTRIVSTHDPDSSPSEVDLRTLVPQGARLKHYLELNLVGTRLRKPRTATEEGKEEGEGSPAAAGDADADKHHPLNPLVTLMPMEIRTFMLSVAPASTAPPPLSAAAATTTR